jgi:hypothetical protein
MRGSFATGRRYYRDPAIDQRRDCDQRMVNAEEAEEALGDFLRRLVLPADWQAQVLAKIHRQAGSAQDVERERRRIQGQLERLKRLFVLGDLDEQAYATDRNRLQAQLVSLTPPAMPNLERAAALLQDFGAIWDAAEPKERKQIAHTLLEAVYLDSGEEGPVVAIRPRAEFEALFDLTGGARGVDLLGPEEGRPSCFR